MKERETAVGVEKRIENLCMWRIYIMRWNRDELAVDVRKRERALDVRKEGGELA